MSVYLHDIPLAVARSRLQAALEESGLWGLLGRETISVDENAVGRVLADPVWARISSPHYHASAMDGFAVRAEDTVGAEPTCPLNLADFTYLDTGDPLPEGSNAVIPIENVDSLDVDGRLAANLRKPARIRIRAAVAPWSHVRPLGEDIIATQLVLPSGLLLRPVDLGAAVSAGHQTISVARRPRVAILPTGSELVLPGSELKAGDILEYNSIVLAAQVKAWGGEPTRYPITPDRFDLICEQVAKAANLHDLVLLNAGSSAGAEDFSARVVEELGTLLVHGVAVRPGHPVILGMLDRSSSDPEHSTPGQVPILGVPGYPVSAALTGDLFVEPLLAKWTGRRPLEYIRETATLTRKITSPGGDDDYVRVVVGRVGKKLLAAPLSRGAGVITSLTRADGLLLLPRGVQGANAGDEVDVQLFRSQLELERTILCIGSHDMTLDLLAQFLARADRRLAAANVGSEAGLIALQRGEAHLAGAHIFDPASGEYNLASIRKYLSGTPVKVFGFVDRQQGLIVGPGNPKSIQGLADLDRPGMVFINRQRGAGTRILLDFELSKLGLQPGTIQGYNQEEYSHLGVAAAVASGRADCGLGILAAARALRLDFVPLFQEKYQLVIPKVFSESDLLAPLIAFLGDPEFQHSVGSMPGYTSSEMGKIIAEV